MDIVSASLLLAAISGYADVDDEGYPSWEERELHVYTNAARVDPEAHEDDYNQGGCSTSDFSGDELEPKRPVYYSRELNEAARFHSTDMRENNWFDHDSSDGTDTFARIARYYTETGNVSENIAQGYNDQWAAVMNGWMCSTSGHRGNIMTGGWQELGVGVNGSYYTQNFASGEPDTDGVGTMVVHVPKEAAAGDNVLFYADINSDADPDSVDVILNGQRVALEVLWGIEDRGVYVIDADLPADRGCSEYYLRVMADGAESRVPEEGSYLIGDCDADFDWKLGQMGISGVDDASLDELVDTLELLGCSTAGSARELGWLGLLMAGLLIRRREL